jgi:hypothetical protein
MEERRINRKYENLDSRLSTTLRNINLSASLSPLAMDGMLMDALPSSLGSKENHL